MTTPALGRLELTPASADLVAPVVAEALRDWAVGSADAPPTPRVPVFTAAIDPDAVCGGDPALSCSSALVGVLGQCARDAKGAMPSASDEELRPLIEACVNEDARFEDLATDCLSCFLDATACASENCLVECLAGDSPACDRCQIESGCTLPVFACGGLPNPF